MPMIAARRQTIIQDICRPRDWTVCARESACLTTVLSASGLPPFPAFSFTSRTFFCTASICILWVALSLTRSRLRPTISCFIASSAVLWATSGCHLAGSSWLPIIRRLTLCFMVLQSSPILSIRLSRPFSDSKSPCSAGLVALRCSPIMSISLTMWSVCDFWSRKCLCESVSISMYVSWICWDTPFMSSPMEVSSMLFTSI
mmetsp:Transcript_48385/g.144482  ORF Transcript_48385/g.144482 Transcript_48385/m.144482 type:complete len:201 (-) Transcript_48385:892-1494(-)